MLKGNTAAWRKQSIYLKLEKGHGTTKDGGRQLQPTEEGDTWWKKAPKVQVLSAPCHHGSSWEATKYHSTTYKSPNHNAAKEESKNQMCLPKDVNLKAVKISFKLYDLQNLAVYALKTIHNHTELHRLWKEYSNEKGSGNSHLALLCQSVKLEAQAATSWTRLDVQPWDRRAFILFSLCSPLPP